MDSRVATENVEALRRRCRQVAESGSTIATAWKQTAPKLEHVINKIVGGADRKIDHLSSIQEHGSDVWWEAYQASNAEVIRAAHLVEQLASGLVTREQLGIDDGWCAIGDELVRSTMRGTGTPWNGVTLPASVTAFDRATETMELRFPVDGVWSLAPLLHELGHFVGGRLVSEQAEEDAEWTVILPLVEHLNLRDRELPAEFHHLHELFADAFATFVGGPAYVASCIHDCWNPADPGHREHPAPSVRIGVMFRLLEALESEPGNAGSLKLARAALSKEWTKYGDATECVAVDDDIVKFLVDMLNTHLPALRYGSLAHAREAGKALRTHELRVSSSTSHVDVLNAAWAERMATAPKMTPADISTAARLAMTGTHQ